MNNAIRDVFEQYQAVFMDRIAEKFEVPREQMEEIWEEIRKTKPQRTKKTKKTTVPSAYILFCRAKRKDLEPMDFGHISKELGKMWRNVDAEEKLFYTNQSNQLRKKKSPPPEEEGPSLSPIVSSTETETETPIAPTKAEKMKKAPRKKDKEEIPDDLEEDAEKELWRELSQFKLQELRTHCLNSSLMPSNTREKMIRALIHYRLALTNPDGQKACPDESDDEEMEW